MAPLLPRLSPPRHRVATYGNEKITFAQLNERLKEPLANMESEYAKQKHSCATQASRDDHERLVEAEAKKRNLTEEQLIKAEVEDKAPTVRRGREEAVRAGGEGRALPSRAPPWSRFGPRS